MRDHWIMGGWCGALLILSALLSVPREETLKSLAPPRSELLIEALDTSLALSSARPFTLSLLRLDASPPQRFAHAAASLTCEKTPWKLRSAPDKTLTVSPDSSDWMLWMLALWLCDPHPIKTLNAADAHLDPEKRAILASDSAFSYRLGDVAGSHVIVDFELGHLDAITYKTSRTSSSYHLIASRRQRDDAQELVTISLSEDGKLAWTARITRDLNE